jgi:hypothetical protein
MPNEEVKIIQIIPADGWRAHFKQDKGQPDALDRVVCFALVELTERGEKRQEVRPMSVADLVVEFCEETQNFSGLSHERQEE